MHKTEQFMQAAVAKLIADMPASVTVTEDDSYTYPEGIIENLNVIQGDEAILNSNLAYTDTRLTFYVDITVVFRSDAAPVRSLLNARRAAIVRSFDPIANGSIALGVAGASQLLEGDSYPPTADHAERPVADLRMEWFVNLRRNVNDPELFT